MHNAKGQLVGCTVGVLPGCKNIRRSRRYVGVQFVLIVLGSRSDGSDQSRPSAASVKSR